MDQYCSYSNALESGYFSYACLHCAENIYVSLGELKCLELRVFEHNLSKICQWN